MYASEKESDLNHECPACNKSLRFRFVKSKVVSGTKMMHGYLYCPKCKIPLMFNEHPDEKKARIILSVGGIIFFVLLASKNQAAFLIGLFVYLVAFLSAIYIWLKPDYRNWSRWIVVGANENL